FATQEGATELKKLSVRHIRFVPVRNTSSLLGHFLTGATKAIPVLSIPASAAMLVLPPSVVRLILSGVQQWAPIQSVSERLEERATSASPHSRVGLGCGKIPQILLAVRSEIWKSRRPPRINFGSVGWRAAL